MSTVSDLTTEINTNLPDNNVQAITPAVTRTTLIDMVTRLSADDVVTASSIATSSGVAGSTTALFGNNTWKVPTVDVSHIATSSGSPSSATILYGDNTWKTAPSPTITGGGLGFTFDSRAAAAGANIPTLGSGGPTWVSTSGYASSGDGGKGLYVRVGSTPAYSNLVWFSSLDGQKWGLVVTNEPLTLEQAGGGRLASAANNSAAVDAIHSIFYTNKTGFTSGGYTYPGPCIQLGFGQYNFSGPWFVKGASNIRGLGSGSAGGYATVLKFPAGSDGLVLGCPNSNGRLFNAGVYGGDYDARGTVIRDLCVTGGWQLNGTTPYSQNNSTGERGIGILSKATCHLENLYINGFAEFGVYIKGTAGATGASVEPTPGTADNTDTSESYVCAAGFANTFYMARVYVETIGCDGFRDRGADANAGSYIECSADLCYAWGYNSLCFLGNFFWGCHSATNGFRWQEQSRLDTNTGKIPGAYQAADASNTANFVSCYSEGGQPGSAFLGFSVVMGGLHAAGSPTQSGSGVRFYNNGSNSFHLDAFSTPTLGGTFSVGLANVDGEVWNFNGSVFWRSQAGRLDMGSFGNSNSFGMTLSSYASAQGRSSNLGSGEVLLARGAWFGCPGANDGFNLRFHGVNDGLPSTGKWARGDQVDMVNPSAGGIWGYVCTTSGDYAGTPPVWKSKGNLAA